MESFEPHKVYDSLRAAAAEVGTNLTQVCQDAGVPRGTVQVWRKRPPVSFVVLGKLLAAIDKRRKAA